MCSYLQCAFIRLSSFVIGQNFMDEIFFQPSFIANKTYDANTIKEIGERVYLNGNVTCIVYQQHQPLNNKEIVPYLTQKIGIDLAKNIFQ